MDYVHEAAIVWLILNTFALWLFEGKWRKAALVPAAIMVTALAIAVLGMIGGSNIVPIWVVFAIPICFVLTIGLWVARGIAWIMKPA
jgi:hypothetical protein